MQKSRVSREERVEQVQSWLASGLSCRAYSRQSGVHQATLSWWKRKLESEGAEPKRRKKRKSQPRPAFVEVTARPEVEEEQASNKCVELHIRDMRLQLPSDFSASSLSRLFDVLEVRR